MFQQKHSFAINFSDYSIQALELVRSHGTLVIKTYNRLLLESGIIENGKIIDAVKMTAAVKQLLAQAQPTPITAREVVITIPESRVFVQTYSLPLTLNEKQVPSALFSQARETMPIDASLIAADYREIGRTEDAVYYIFAATYSNLIDEYVAFFQSLQIKVALITMESLALAAATLDEKSEETFLLLDIGARTTIASIFKYGELRESININIAGNNITAALAEKLKISTAEAEQRKMTQGMQFKAGDGAEMLITQGQLQPLKDELLVFIKYYEQKMKDPISRVFLAGGTSAMFGIDQYFAENLGLPVSLAQPLPFFQVPLDQSTVPKFLVALGLGRIAIGERKQGVNFIERKERDWLPDKKSLKSITDSVQARGFSPIVQKKKMSSKKRTLLLALLLLCTVGLFGGILLWKYFNSKYPLSSQQGPGVLTELKDGLNVVVKPVSTDQENNGKVLTFSFIARVTGTPTTSAEFAAAFERIQIVNIVPFDSKVLQTVTAALRAQTGSSEFDQQQIDTATAEYLADRLWEQSEDYYGTEKRSGGKYLVPSYVEKTIDTNDSKVMQRIDGAKPGQMRVNASYDVLVLANGPSFEAYEKDSLASFEKYSPGWIVQSKTFDFDQSQPDFVKVTALYVFKQASN